MGRDNAIVCQESSQDGGHMLEHRFVSSHGGKLRDNVVPPERPNSMFTLKAALFAFPSLFNKIKIVKHLWSGKTYSKIKS